jgi:hypothetical protein
MIVCLLLSLTLLTARPLLAGRARLRELAAEERVRAVRVEQLEGHGECAVC